MQKKVKKSIENTISSRLDRREDDPVYNAAVRITAIFFGDTLLPANWKKIHDAIYRGLKSIKNRKHSEKYQLRDDVANQLYQIQMTAAEMEQAMARLASILYANEVERAVVGIIGIPPA